MYIYVNSANKFYVVKIESYLFDCYLPAIHIQQIILFILTL